MHDLSDLHLFFLIHVLINHSSPFKHKGGRFSFHGNIFVNFRTVKTSLIALKSCSLSFVTTNQSDKSCNFRYSPIFNLMDRFPFDGIYFLYIQLLKIIIILNGMKIKIRSILKSMVSALTMLSLFLTILILSELMIVLTTVKPGISS